MDKTCDTCFYEDLLGTEHPCTGCFAHPTDYVNWVSVDFLSNVDEDVVSIFDAEPTEGMCVMDRMAGELIRIKPALGVKHDSNKPRWSLLPFGAINEVVEVLGFGAKKYADDNWKHVPEAQTRYVDAAFRHLTDWHLKEKLDGETGKSHLAHAICCLLFLLWFEQEERSPL